MWFVALNRWHYTSCKEMMNDWPTASTPVSPRVVHSHLEVYPAYRLPAWPPHSHVSPHILPLSPWVGCSWWCPARLWQCCSDNWKQSKEFHTHTHSHTRSFCHLIGACHVYWKVYSSHERNVLRMYCLERHIFLIETYPVLFIFQLHGFNRIHIRGLSQLRWLKAMLFWILTWCQH